MLFCASISSYASTTTIEIIPEEISNGSSNEGITPYYNICSCGGQIGTVTWIERYGSCSCRYNEIYADQYARKLRAPKCGSCGNLGYTELLGKGRFCSEKGLYYDVTW